MSKVSVIIPNYNHEAYLIQRINSVLEQTYTDFEVIILDDCSTDNSREIIETYRNNKKISDIVYNIENSGNPFFQWNKGINLAKGEYIWIAESDDWCETNLLSTIITGLEVNHEAVVGYCQSYCVTSSGDIQFQSGHTKLVEYVDGKEFIRDYILPRNPIFNAGMAVWRREAYNKISKDFIHYRLIGDYCFWVEICKQGSVFISGKLLNYFRTHEKNVSLNAFRNGMIFTEQVPYITKLLNAGVIDRKVYLQTLKRMYSIFRFTKKKMPKKNIKIVNKAFSSSAVFVPNLKAYFYIQYIKSTMRKLF